MSQIPKLGLEACRALWKIGVRSSPFVRPHFLQRIHNYYATRRRQHRRSNNFNIHPHIAGVPYDWFYVSLNEMYFEYKKSLGDNNLSKDNTGREHLPRYFGYGDRVAATDLTGLVDAAMKTKLLPSHVAEMTFAVPDPDADSGEHSDSDSDSCTLDGVEPEPSPTSQEGERPKEKMFVLSLFSSTKRQPTQAELSTRLPREMAPAVALFRKYAEQVSVSRGLIVWVTNRFHWGLYYDGERFLMTQPE
ncbi:hypothetical protein SLS62_008238 [Diatrype stigma]|uniref:Uncharacterized protein n=1 Tax=Diatrype stigma TaxID=117547 RepID=A0AAN9YP44_9PEZI